MPLTTLTNLKEQLDLVGSHVNLPDSYLYRVIDRAGARCEAIVGRELESATFTEYVDGCGTRSLELRRGPITSVTSVSYVEYSGTGIETARALAVGDYFFYGRVADGWKLPGRIESNGSVFTQGQRNYKVVYVAGFATIPNDLEQAALYAAVTFINTRKDAATASRDVGSGALQFILPADSDEHLHRLLAPYRDLRAA